MDNISLLYMLVGLVFLTTVVRVIHLYVMNRRQEKRFLQEFNRWLSKTPAFKERLSFQEEKAQRESFVYANCKLDNDDVTREMVKECRCSCKEEE